MCILHTVHTHKCARTQTHKTNAFITKETQRSRLAIAANETSEQNNNNNNNNKNEYEDNEFKVIGFIIIEYERIYYKKKERSKNGRI